MADLPELSASTKRKLELQWHALLEANELTGDHLHWHEREMDRRARIAAQSPVPSADWSDLLAADDVGVYSTIRVTESRFDDLVSERWERWLSSGDGYERFAGWLEVIKRQVSDEVASI